MIDAEAQGVRLDADAGAVLTARAPAGRRLSVGDRVSAFVRPEYIAIDAAGASGDANALSGRIDSLLFNGANSRLLVRSDAGALIEADVTLTGDTDDPRPGDAVRLGFAAERTLCFAAADVNPAASAP